MNKQQEPRLRFKGFSGAWEYKKFENVLSIKSGMSQKEIEVSDGIYPILATGGEIGRTNTALYDKESVLIGRKGTIDKPYYMNTPFWTVDTLFYSELKNNIDGKFLYFLFQCIEWRKLDTSTGVPSLTSTTIHEIQRYFPSKPEQTHLGLFFRRLDSQIAESRAVLEKSRQLKKAMLAKMFPANGEKIPKIRFKGFEGEWECRKFSEVAELRRGLTYSPLDISQNGIRVLRSSNIDEEYYIEKNDDVFVCERAVNIPLVQNGDILITAANGSSRLVGKHAIIQTSIPAVHGGFMLLARTENPYFLNASMSSAWYLNFIRIFVAGGNGAIGNLSIGDLNEQEILIPKNPEEQTAIGNFFRQLDETIALQSAEVEKLNQLKKGLLAAMLV